MKHSQSGKTERNKPTPISEQRQTTTARTRAVERTRGGVPRGTHESMKIAQERGER